MQFSIWNIQRGLALLVLLSMPLTVGPCVHPSFIATHIHAYAERQRVLFELLAPPYHARQALTSREWPACKVDV